MNNSLFASVFLACHAKPSGITSGLQGLGNANVCSLHVGEITLIMCGWTDRMVAIERCNYVRTDGGLCYYSWVLASGRGLCGV